MSEKQVTQAIARLAKEVRKERKKQSLTQTELADMAGVSLNFLSQLEQGKHTTRMDKVLNVLQVLGIELKIAYGKNGITK